MDEHTDEQPQLVMRFIYSRNGRIVGVRCGCGWTHTGPGGSTVNAVEWSNHKKREHPDKPKALREP
jgi:hypothetical protein